LFLKYLALRLIKILILAAISPRRTVLTIRHLGDMLLHRITDLDPEINYQFIADLLSKLYQQGAYLAYEKSEDFMQDVYRIDLEANVNAIVQRKIESILAGLEEEDHRIYQRILKNFSEPFLPLKNFIEQPAVQEEYLWQQTTRNGWRLFGNLSEIPNEQLQQIASQIHQAEVDFLILIASPEKALTQKKHYADELRPFLADLNLLDYTITWIPSNVEDHKTLREFYALQLLSEKYKDDHSPTGRKVFEFLHLRLQEEQRLVKEILAQSYLKGELLVGDYPETFDQLGLLPFTKMMEQMIDRLLHRRFPKHLDIAPYSAVYSPGRLNDAIQKFFKPGSVSLETIDSGLRAILESYLKPLGLLARAGSNIQLRVDSRHSPLVQYFMDFVEEQPVEVKYLYIRIPFVNGKKISLEKITAYNLHQIDQVGKGEVLDERTIIRLKDVPFIDEKLKQQKFSLQLQEKIYQQVRENVAHIYETISFLERQISESQSQPQFKQLPFESFKHHLEFVRQVLDKIKLGRNSKESLQQLTDVLEMSPLFSESYHNLQQISRFFYEYKNAYAKIYDYLNHPDMIIPKGAEYLQLQQMQDELLQLLGQENLVFSEEFPRLIDLFQHFQKEYISQYLLEHQQQKGSEAFQWIHQVRHSQAYQLLRRLSTLRSIDVSPSAFQIEAELNEISENICERLTTEILKIQPVCACEFHLGDKTTRRQVLSDFMKRIQEGIEAYFKILQSPSIINRLKEFIETTKKLKQTEKQQAIESFLQLKNANEFSAWVSASNLKILKEALENEIVVHEITLEDLAGKFLNRTVEISQFRQYLLNYLDKISRGKKETFVRLLERKPVEKSYLKKKISQNSPYLFNLFPDWNEDDWRHFLIAATWISEHRLSGGSGRF